MPVMKIGVLGCFYNCADLLPRVLAPWKELKTAARSDLDIIFVGVNAQFAEYAQMGYPDNDEETRALLHASSVIDHLAIAEGPLTEAQVRQAGLEKLLREGVDLVWLVDGDEVYTLEQIKNILRYVEDTPQYDYYHIHFDNRIFGATRWTDDFFPPRIVRTNRRGGIARFTFDNEIQWQDGTTLNDCVPGIVPKRVAHVEHHTWRLADAEKKINYQEKHFGYSMFRMGTNGPEFNPEYFKKFNMPLPTQNLSATQAEQKLPEKSLARENSAETELRDGRSEDFLKGVSAELAFSSQKEPLDIILRTHLGAPVHGGKRVTDAQGGKRELIVRCLRSIINSALRLERRNDTLIRLHLLDDHSAPDLCVELQSMLALCPFETSFVSIAAAGNGPSLRACYDYARGHADTLVYFVEDDYLHEPTALEEMVDAYRAFSRNAGQQVGIFPIDYVHLYEPDRIALTRLVAGTRRHWRLIAESTCTFMTHADVVQKHWDKFVELSENGVIESVSINAVWRNAVPLFSPIPTLTYHMHHEELMPPFSNWRRLWNSVAT
jgi:hypothetical protein